jgi:hypothetical protein
MDWKDFKEREDMHLWGPRLLELRKTGNVFTYSQIAKMWGVESSWLTITVWARRYDCVTIDQSTKPHQITFDWNGLEIEEKVDVKPQTKWNIEQRIHEPVESTNQHEGWNVERQRGRLTVNDKWVVFVDNGVVVSKTLLENA